MNERSPRIEDLEAGSTRGLLHESWAGFRGALRIAAFAASNLGVAACFFLGWPMTFGNRERRRRLRDWAFGTWARLSLACVGVRVEVRGSPPKGPCFLVANHLVYLDTWVIASQTPAVFVAESGIASWPFFGFMARRLSIIFIDRKNKRAIPEVNRRMEEALAEGHVLALFPEGTTGRGDHVLSFRSSLLEPAARGGHPVAWATIVYRTRPPDPPASKVVVWKDGVKLPPHAKKLLRLDRVEATVTFGEGSLRGTDRKALAADLHRRVQAAFSPIP